MAYADKKHIVMLFRMQRFADFNLICQTLTPGSEFYVLASLGWRLNYSGVATSSLQSRGTFDLCISFPGSLLLPRDDLSQFNYFAINNDLDFWLFRKFCVLRFTTLLFVVPLFFRSTGL